MGNDDLDDIKDTMLTHEQAIMVVMKALDVTYEEAEAELLEAFESGKLPRYAIQ